MERWILVQAGVLVPESSVVSVQIEQRQNYKALVVSLSNGAIFKPMEEIGGQSGVDRLYYAWMKAVSIDTPFINPYIYF